MTQGKPVERILIYRLGSFGDTVVALPALHLVTRSFPHARRVLLSNMPAHSKAPAASAVLTGSGLVDGYIQYQVGTRNLGHLIKLWRDIRSFRPQILVYLAAVRGPKAIARDVRFFRACGIQKIIGVPSGDTMGPRYLPQLDLWEHESSRLVRTLHELGGCDVEDKRNWDLRLTEEEKNIADRELASIAGMPQIACGPGTKMQAKDWGQENWRRLLAKLSERFPGYALIMVGAKEEREMSEFAAGEWQGPVVNLCGRLTPRGTAAALRYAELFMGPDSGLMHIASAMSIPCASVFAARAKPGTWYPVGSEHRVIYHRVECMGCNLETCIEQKKKCLTSVSPDEMLAAALDAWNCGRANSVAV